jgi:regulator of protease activity HflC (stomatin/prohibitin superfamily)
MRNLTVSILTVAFAILSSACMTRIEPGNVGLKVSNLGSDRGVSAEVLSTGMVGYVPGMTQIIEYPSYVKRYEWRASRVEGEANEEICFNTSGGSADKEATGVVVCGDLAFGLWVEGNSAPTFYKKYRVTDLDHFAHGILRDVTRSAFNEVGVKLTVEEVLSSKRKDLETDAEKVIKNHLAKDGVRIANIGFTSALRPPQAITDRINAKIAAIQDSQRVENELRTTEAEAKKQVAQAEGNAKARIEAAQGEAKSNQILLQSITPQLIEWRRLELQQAAVQKWNGSVPQVQMGGSGGGAVPFLDVTKFAGK